VIGPVLDVEFNPKELPEISTRCGSPARATKPKTQWTSSPKCNSTWAKDAFRAVALQPTDECARHEGPGSGRTVTVPVGRATLGRVMNVLGQPVDKRGPISAEKTYPIHRPAPSLLDQSTTLEMFETGIKVVDLMEPYLKAARSGSSAARAWARPC